MDNNLEGIIDKKYQDSRDEIADQILSGLSSTLGKPVNPEHQLIRDNFHEFGRLVMGRKDMPFHTKMRQMLEDEREAVFLLPRGFAKSSIVSVEFPLWLLGKNRDLRIIIATNALRLGEEWLREIENVMANNQLYKDVYGNLIPVDRTGTWTDKEKIVNGRSPSATHTSLYVVSTTGSVLGKRADVIICDDLFEPEKGIPTEGQIRGIKEWFWKSLYPILEPGVGKMFVIGCLPADSKIQMKDGTYKRIVDISVGDNVASFDGGLLCNKDVVGVIPQGIAPVYKVRTVHHELKATSNHPFLTITTDGYKWVPVSDLKVGDHVITQKYSDVTTICEYDSDFMWLLGFLFGDGWITQTTGVNKRKSGSSHISTWKCLCCAASNNTAMNDKVVNLIGKYFEKEPTYKPKERYYRLNSVSACDKLLSLGLLGKAKTKRIPEWIFTIGDDLKHAFINGVIDADGTRISNSYKVELANKLFIEDLYYLSLTCGVRATLPWYRSRLVKAPNSKEVIKSQTWSTYLSFGDKVLYKKQFGKLVDHIPFRIDKVTSIEYAGEEEVFDLSVNDTHNFFANGICVHNTRFHQLDLYADLLDRNWAGFTQAALIKDESTGEEVSAWPERFSTEELQKRRNSMGSIIFNLQYQNNADISSRLQLEFLHFVDEKDIPNDLVIYQGVDPCLAVGANSDYFVIATIGVSEKTGKGYLLDLVRARVGFHQQLEIIMQQAAMWNPRKIGIETNAAQVFIKEALQDAENSPSPTVKRLSRRKFNLPIFPVVSKSSKQSRIMEMSAMFESGLISIKATKDNQGLVPTSNIEPFVSEWLMFPQGKHDDCLDGVAHAVKVAEFGLPPPIFSTKERDIPYYRRRPKLTMFHK